MKAIDLKKLINVIPDEAEVKFEREMIYLDTCMVEEYPEKWLNGYKPFYYLKPVSEEEKGYCEKILHGDRKEAPDDHHQSNS